MCNVLSNSSRGQLDRGAQDHMRGTEHWEHQVNM